MERFPTSELHKADLYDIGADSVKRVRTSLLGDTFGRSCRSRPWGLKIPPPPTCARLILLLPRRNDLQGRSVGGLHAPQARGTSLLGVDLCR